MQLIPANTAACIAITPGQSVTLPNSCPDDSSLPPTLLNPAYVTVTSAPSCAGLAAFTATTTTYTALSGLCQLNGSSGYNFPGFPTLNYNIDTNHSWQLGTYTDVVEYCIIGASPGPSSSPPTTPPPPTPVPSPTPTLAPWVEKFIVEYDDQYPNGAPPNDFTGYPSTDLVYDGSEIGTANALRKAQQITLPFGETCYGIVETRTESGNLQFRNIVKGCDPGSIVKIFYFDIGVYDVNSPQPNGTAMRSESRKVPCASPGPGLGCDSGWVAVVNPGRSIVKITSKYDGTFLGDYDASDERYDLIPINDLGVEYPKVYPYPGNSTLKVPFPLENTPFSFCPNAYRGRLDHPECPASKQPTFRMNTIAYYGAQGLTVPFGVADSNSGGYETHHIKPSACGGGMEGFNGVFLTRTQHELFNQWWDDFTLCATRGTRLPPDD
jgi:hypothetical protein